MSDHNHVVVVDAQNSIYPIRPEDIETNTIGALSTTFGKREIELAAKKLVMFFQSKGHWSSFTLNELKQFYIANKWKFGNHFFGLLGMWFDDGSLYMCFREPKETFIVKEGDLYYVTDLFIETCAGNMR